ncbi:PP2C family serine/threonine-protein phosphatase [Streptomyces albus]|uniref:PP2C family serine/threonine-protein phosphatase n=1 Tax=Streptomyces albus TaxID=1888 RepID=UPI0024AD9AE5|nr:protein phosphatase 2C domain-containing protein [Streptomyces albus]MDI6408123.1 protein phosphatase 2C domain-containing protein [Streptomyces albus]
MPQLDQLSTCPSCAEPLETGDRFCGACGADLEAAVRARTANGTAAADGTPDRTPTLPDGAPPPPGPPPPVPDVALPHPHDHGEHTPPPPPPPPGAPQPPAGPAPGGPGAAPHPPAAHEPAGPVTGPAPPAGAAPGPRADGVPYPDGTARQDVPGGPVPGAAEAASGPAGDGLGPVVEDGPPDGPETLAPTCVACGTGAIDDDGYCRHCGHKQPRDRDHMESELGTVAAASDRGLRHHRNEDFYAIAETTTPQGAPATVAVVCDGVSSATRPDDASAAAAEAASTALCTALPDGRHPQEAMHEALVAAAEAVDALAADTPPEPSKNAPACTVVSALCADGVLTVGWIGDSRAYWVPDDRSAAPVRLTEDDSWAAQMVAAGLMNEAEAYADPRAHAITGWLGADAYEIDPHTASFRPEEAGVVVVCTDGLWNYAESAEEMAAALPPDAAARPLQCARHLVGYALDGGGHDNVTVAVVPFPAPRGGAVSA